jgi:Abortive infection C-terminus
MATHRQAADRALDPFEAATDLRTMMITRVTSRTEVDARAFTRARKAVLADPIGARIAPLCVRTCRSPDDVWSYIKSQSALDTYHSRRVFLGEQFAPLLTALEDSDDAPVDHLVSSEIDRLDSASVARDWERALARRSSDPEAAITAARALVESVCKTILDDLEINYTERDDLPKLYRKTASALDLTPDQYTDEQIKRILGGATSAIEGLGALRNRGGDAHGRGRSTYRLSARHAALAVNLAGTVTMFLTDTFRARSD